MNRIIRFWNQNRKGILVIVLAIILLIVVIQVLNQIAKRQRLEKENIQISEEDKMLPTQSIIGGDSVSKEETKSNVEIIESFIEKCNNKDYASAYQMLTNDCKEILFTTEENFKKGYVDIIFNKPKISNIENFLSKNGRHTYLVNLYDDILSTGNVANAGSYKDYITIDKDKKLNINSFIYKQEINKTVEGNGVKVTVVSQQIFKENEKYEIKIQNISDKRILIDTGKKRKSIYVIGENNVSYASFIAEFSSALLEIPSNLERNYEIKFNKIYSIGINTKAVVFSDIVPDYDAYTNNEAEQTQRIKVTVEI